MDRVVVSQVYSKSATLKGSQRKYVFNSYRKRGHKNSNLWLVYSPKMNRDLMLNSDIEFLFWLQYLEGDSSVHSFQVWESEGASEPSFKIKYRDGRISACYIIGEQSTALSPRSLVIDDVEANTEFFTVENIKNHAAKAQRWLKPIAYAAAIRGRALIPLHNALVVATQRYESGRIEELMSMLDDFQMDEVLGMIMRHCALGILKIDLQARPFGNYTDWKKVI